MRRLFSALLAAGALLAFSAGPANAAPLNHINHYYVVTEDGCVFGRTAPHWSGDFNPSDDQQRRRDSDCGRTVAVEAGSSRFP